MIVPWRGPRPPPDPRTGRRPHRRQRRARRVNIRWLCLRPLEQLDEYEHEALEAVLADDEASPLDTICCSAFDACWCASAFVTWTPGLDDATTSGLNPFMSLARFPRYTGDELYLTPRSDIRETTPEKRRAYAGRLRNFLKQQ